MTLDLFSRRVQTWTALTALAWLVGCSTPPAPPPDAQIPAPTPEVVPAKPKRLGLALGGGGARGFAHVGVLQVLEEAGIKPDLVVGTSAGSLVGALYASGKTGAQLQRIAETMEESTITDWALPFLNRGVLRGEALARYVSNQTQGRKIEDLPIRLGIVATDLNLGEGVLFQRGDTATAVRASSAVPSVFLPVRINNRDYVDGGLVAPVPVRSAREMGAEVVVAVTSCATPLLAKIPVARIKIGDLEDMEVMSKEHKVQLLIGNSHAVATAERLGVPILRAGFPLYDMIGGYQKTWVGYRGTRQTLFDLANLVINFSHDDIPVYRSLYAQKPFSAASESA